MTATTETQRTKNTNDASGFALIATISVMVLLVMVALAMLALSTLETRSARHGDAQAEARANARLALMMALGELQKSAGPDQRITTNAAVFDTRTSGGSAGIPHPHYLGVLDSWDTFLNERKYLRDKDGAPTSSAITIQDTYREGRHPGLFRRYLVSNPDPAKLESYEAATRDSVLNLQDSNSVLLVGPGTTGGTTPDLTVRAGLLDITKGSRTTGRQAWWVGGLNSRASLNLYNPESTAGGLAGKRDAAEDPRTHNVTAMDGLGNLSDQRNDRLRMVTTKQAEIGLPSKSPVQNQSFNLAANDAWSLLADVRNSGMKKCLNSFFELDRLAVPSEYKTASFMNVAVEAPLRSVNGLAALNPIEKNVPPTSWRQLRDYYSVYLQNGGSSNHLGVPQAHLSWHNSSVPMSDSFMCGQARRLAPWHHDYDNADTLGYHRMPVIARWLYVFSLSSQRVGDGVYDLYVHHNPVIVLWNPYNTMLRLQNRGTQYISGHKTVDSDFMIQPSFHRALNLQYRLYTKSGTTEVPRTWWNSFPLTNFGKWSWWDVHFKDKGGEDVVLKPGEVKIFSFDSSTPLGSELNHFTPGFDPQIINHPFQRSRVARISGITGASIALRFTDSAGVGSGQPETSTTYGGPQAAFAMDSLGQSFNNSSGTATKTTRGHRGGNIIEWFTQRGVQIIPDKPGERAAWNLGNTKPIPQAAVGVFLKTATELPEDNGALASSKDVRTRNWLHSNPTHWWRQIYKPDPLKRTNYPYEIHYNGNLGGNGVAALVQSDDDNAYIGASIEASDGTSSFTYQELPIAPVTNLAALSGMRLSNGKTLSAPQPMNNPNWGAWGRNVNYAGSWNSAFGVGIGNSFAHPMINPTNIYSGQRTWTNYSNQPTFANQWDTVLMANDALWDSWFCSSIATQPSPAYSAPRSRDNVISQFVGGTKALPNQRIGLYRSNKTGQEIISAFKSDEAYKKLASHLWVRAGFNVNNASVDAWKALLHGLKGRTIPYIDSNTLKQGDITGYDDLVLSRFGYATGADEGSGPQDPRSWNGIRKLTDRQIDRLAEEMVRQVKLRGPFLNMSEFINRRLSNDKFGVTGALQAAIDWDEFDSNYSGQGNTGAESINGRFKGTGDMITAPTADYPNPMAAKGSRYAGIPGYVIQSDLLRAMGNTLTVRDDSFVIRAYGDALDGDGNVIARAWCEAVVQRVPDYLVSDDDRNAPEKPAYQLDSSNRPVASATLGVENRKFGRRFVITGFRWLSPEDVL